jgi:hypothetical protein
MSFRDDVSKSKPVLSSYNARLFYTHSPMSGVIGRVCVRLYKSCMCGGGYYQYAYVLATGACYRNRSLADLTSLSRATLFFGALNNRSISAQVSLLRIVLYLLKVEYVLK